MSKFLGPIHFWLYNKIGNQEKLTQAIADLGTSKGWIPSAEPYVKELPPLESVIDEGNIHGWLQSQISDAETRYAALITRLSQSESFDMNQLLQAASDFGKAHEIPSQANAMEAYKTFEDFFVNGMPCDHVNVLVSQSPEKLVWNMAQDIHAPYWEQKNSEQYYQIRKAVMDGMLSQSRLRVTMDNLYQYSIEAI